MPKEFSVKKGGAFKDWRVMDAVGNVVCKCTWLNAAKRIAKLLNADT